MMVATGGALPQGCASPALTYGHTSSPVGTSTNGSACVRVTVLEVRLSGYTTHPLTKRRNTCVTEGNHD